MIVKLLTKHHLESLSLKGGCTGSLSLHLSKCHIVGNHMSQLKFDGLLSDPASPLTSSSDEQSSSKKKRRRSDVENERIYCPASQE